ncbi:ABC transporter ATP-binding protein [Priestia aryabhattai]|uniref:ABC transporter ATP-binding protein n=2 Tax=Priestia aryabhattai TaxID=412384 RepID=A0ABD7WY79_PRIAR|nr:ABC transporter ATP-binding protein [Priestia aryabhattai]MBY0027429.1 ABC transporter ATP-binding protein [Priestia aryabhattai]WEA45324.1 ABC transporter ATP-binding protein [Priestia aryabhattai]
MKMHSISLSNVSKSYGSHKAVKDLNLTVESGELFGFLGPNGAGKTTTIKMMTGLLEPSSGSIDVCGINVWNSPIEAKRKIAYVPDQPTLYLKLTGMEYLQFIASIFKLSADEFEKRSNKWLSLFQLEERANELIEGYSHGMKQKIALCGALLHNPEIIFLDEPTVGLDPKSARTLKNLLRSLCDNGVTVFITTHILEIAEQLCDRIGIILDGEVIALGSMKELREQANNDQSTLEDIFLNLTGNEEQQNIIEELAKAGEIQ